jgi:hypothetical protein
MPAPTEDAIRTWTIEERAQVARALDRLTERPGVTPILLVRRRLSIVSAAVASVVLLPWVGYLAVSLPLTESGGAWRFAWVGFDVVLAIVLMMTAWLGFRRRQVAVLGMLVAATMLFTDAWFDVALSYGTRGLWRALLSALVLEVPFAILLASSAVSVLRRTAATVARLRGNVGPPTAFWRQQFMIMDPGMVQHHEP